MRFVLPFSLIRLSQQQFLKCAQSVSMSVDGCVCVMIRENQPSPIVTSLEPFGIPRLAGVWLIEDKKAGAGFSFLSLDEAPLLSLDLLSAQWNNEQQLDML